MSPMGGLAEGEELSSNPLFCKINGLTNHTIVGGCCLDASQAILCLPVSAAQECDSVPAYGTIMPTGAILIRNRTNARFQSLTGQRGPRFRRAVVPLRGPVGARQAARLGARAGLAGAAHFTTHRCRCIFGRPSGHGFSFIQRAIALSRSLPLRWCRTRTVQTLLGSDMASAPNAATSCLVSSCGCPGDVKGRWSGRCRRTSLRARSPCRPRPPARRAG
jgi:hypothetical protein